jgi:hypothetical protein
MAHTADWPGRSAVAPWDGQSDGDCVYRAIPCSGNAPVNNLSSNLPSYNSLIAGSRSPASTRSHPFRFTVTNGRLVGSIDLTVCQLAPGPCDDGIDDAQRDRIYVRFEAQADVQTTASEVTFSGRFTLVGGSGRYEQLTGTGTIQGAFFCLQRPGEAGDPATSTMLRDVQYALVGTYADPAFDAKG